MRIWLFNLFLALYVLMGLLLILVMLRINVQINETEMGASGLSGPSGPQGGRGADGQGGNTGVSGVSGISGVSGGSGLPGLFGAVGASGVQGASGPCGFPGNRGASGGPGASGLPATDTLNNYSVLWCSYLPGPTQLAWDTVHHPYNYISNPTTGQVQYGGQTAKTTGAICLKVQDSYWAGTTVPWDRFVFINSTCTGGWAVANSDPNDSADPPLSLTSGVNPHDTLLFADNVVTMGTYYVEITVCDMVDSYCSVLLDDKEIMSNESLVFTPSQVPPVTPYTFANLNGWMAINLQRNLTHYTEGFSGPSGNSPVGFNVNTDFTWQGVVGVGASGPHTFSLFYQSNCYPVPNTSPTDRISVPDNLRPTRAVMQLWRVSDVVLT